MTIRSDRLRKMKELLADHDNESLFSRSQSLRMKSSGSVKLPSKKHENHDYDTYDEDESSSIAPAQLPSKRRISRQKEQPAEKSVFNSKPNYRWLFEPDSLKGKQYKEQDMESWLRGVFSRKSVKFRRYDLLMLMLSFYRPVPLHNSLSINDLSSQYDLRRASVSTLQQSVSGQGSPGGSTQNLRSIALQQQQQLKSQVLLQQQQIAARRRLSGSMSSLDQAALLIAPLPGPLHKPYQTKLRALPKPRYNIK